MEHLPVPNVEKREVVEEDDTEERNRLWAAIRAPENPLHKEIVPSTIKWLVRLPVKVRPLLLASHFPRIANVLAAAWPVPEKRKKVVEDLLWDRRGNRKGFLVPIFREVQTLHSFLMAGSAAEATIASSAVMQETTDGQSGETQYAKH